MSCRETHGNSAVTSLAKFLAQADEKSVSHQFHVVRKEGAAALGIEAKDPADAAQVAAFLARARHAAGHDLRVPEVRRDSLLRRLDAAEADLAEGRLPNRATFYAWQALQERLEADGASSKAALRAKAAATIDPSTGLTPEGLPITAGDVQAAQRDYERLRDVLDTHNNLDPAPQSYRSRERRKFMSLEVGAARDRFQRLQEAYDSTDTGFETLLASAAADPNHAEHAAWAERSRAAQARRATATTIIASKQAASATTSKDAGTVRDTTWGKVLKQEAAYRSSPTARARSAYDQAVKDYQKAQRVYLYALISEREDLASAVGAGDLRSAQAWAGLSGDTTVSRLDLWRAVDLHAVDIDNAEVRIGRISEVEGIRRSLARAEARQAVLDSEGRAEIDPINRRFAESLRRKRSGAA